MDVSVYLKKCNKFQRSRAPYYSFSNDPCEVLLERRRQGEEWLSPLSGRPRSLWLRTIEGGSLVEKLAIIMGI